MTFNDYVDYIDLGFLDEHDFNMFLNVIADDEKINARQYYYLRHKAIERFYE